MYRILHSLVPYIARTDVNRYPVGIGAEERTETQKENSIELDNGSLAAIRQQQQQQQKVPRHTKHGPDINGCSSHGCCMSAFQTLKRAHVQNTWERALFPCSLPAAVVLLPLCAFNVHLPPSFALSPIYFGSLLLSLRLSHKWPSVLISFVCLLVGLCRTFVISDL